MPRKISDRLVMRRNRKLLERFEYLFNKKRLRYDDVLTQLSEDEFFIGPKRIMEIIRKERILKEEEAEAKKAKQLNIWNEDENQKANQG